MPFQSAEVNTVTYSKVPAYRHCAHTQQKTAYKLQQLQPNRTTLYSQYNFLSQPSIPILQKKNGYVLLGRSEQFQK